MNPTRQKTKILTWVTAVFILLCGIFIGGYLVLKSGRGTASELSDILKGKTFESGVCEPNPQDAKSDADEDGLPDWQEEQVYKTDPCQQDSDGDGYLDGEEVAAGYDPAKAAPGDELPGTTSGSRSLPSNLTLALKQKLIEQITQNKLTAFSTEGDVLSYDDLKIFPSVLKTVEEITLAAQQAFAPEKIDKEQIKITEDNSVSAIKTYASALTETINSSRPASLTYQTEQEMIVRALETKNLSGLKEAEKYYQDVCQKADQLTVPSDFLPLHKEMLEIFSATGKIYGAMQSFADDPLKTNLALLAYQNVNTQIYGWLDKLSGFIKQHSK